MKIHLEKKDYNKAEQELQKILTIDPLNEEAEKRLLEISKIH